ncbi:hypothetical protein SUGI_0393790 [Cryptomeria japonica]|uniref:uncharacterized protein LOC131040991 n=1 Tax=Cryptomeria japonica TaxID=3369 RepID=UPI002408A6E1|nr:uncharacterized protein LOC131040991 [Cryptomeria japonica]GLJ21389.1 hypothetical protein SUGI_0393790 [Cryptomeria japonica]
MADFQSGSGHRLHLEHMGGGPPLLVEAPSCEKPISISSLVGLEGDRTSSYLGSFNREGWEDATAIPFYSHSTELDGRRHSASISNNGGAYCCALTTHTHLPTLTSGRAFSTTSTTSTPVSTPNSCLESAIRPVIPDNSCDSENPSSNCLNIAHPSPEDSSVNNAVNESSVNVTDLWAELERERQKNAELSEKISSLEAQLQPSDKDSLDSSVQDASHRMLENSSKKLKRARKGQRTDQQEDAKTQTVLNIVSKVMRENLHTVSEVNVQHNTIVNWISPEKVQVSGFNKIKYDDSAMDECVDSDESDEEDDDADEDNEDEVEDKNTEGKFSGKKLVMNYDKCVGTEMVFQEPEQLSMVLDDGKNLVVKVEIKNNQNEGSLANKDDVNGSDISVKGRIKKTKVRMKNKRYRLLDVKKLSSHEIGPVRSSSNVLSYKKFPKMAFCPEEVKRIMESGLLAVKNAQSHTIRKIIVFSSLGIRHGCEDMYELDFNCFSILRRGEPYASQQDPGEHVLYEQPGMRRKIFFPNRQNPILCPVQILEEEKAMRPSDSSCPSCLFLCIKYGGRTRNLPQNEYVRQRMGRNKLKSFGPLICQMALLVHIRTGSFFFKALGITLLFMAGFPNDFIQKETKYHNLDLLQKYYRSDEDTEGEELFHTYPILYATQAMTNAPSLQGKRVSGQGKLSGKKKPPLLLSKPQMPQKIYMPSISARSMSTRFGLVGFPTFPVTTGAALPSLPHHTFPSASASSNIAITSSTAFRNSPFPPLPPYAIFTPFAVQRPPNGVLSMPMWHNVNSYPKNMYPYSSYGCQSIPPLYGFHRSHPYYNHSFFSSFPSDVKEGMGKHDELNESNSDLDGSSSEADEKCNQSNSSDEKVM